MPIAASRRKPDPEAAPLLELVAPAAESASTLTVRYIRSATLSESRPPRSNRAMEWIICYLAFVALSIAVLWNLERHSSRARRS